MSCKETIEIFKERISEIKRKHKEGVKRRFEEDELLSMCEDLINIVCTLNQKSIQDNATIKQHIATIKYMNKKFQMSSLYRQQIERYKNVDIYIIMKDSKTGTNDVDFKNVDVEIKEKFIQVYNGTRYFNYNINEVIFYELRYSIDREYIENDNKILQYYINKESEED